MALDHVRLFLTAAQFDPLAVGDTTPAYFATRWITHLCAPGFFFLAGLSADLAGLSADLAGRRMGSRAEVTRFLASRGVLLMLLEIVVFGLAWSFNPGWWWFGVIWGLGASLLVLAVLIHLPRPVLLAAGGFLALFHQVLADALPAHSGNLSALLFTGGMTAAPIIGSRLVLYPLLPWLALMILGYGLAPWLAPKGQPRADRFALAGAAGLTGFVACRLLGLGDPAPSFPAPDDWTTGLMVFLNVEKYPPSPAFAMVTLGTLALIVSVAALTEGRKGQRFLAALALFGRVPMFFYSLHLFLIHGLAVAFAVALGWPSGYLVWRSEGPNISPPDGYGLGLPGIYAAWALVMLILTPACAAFGRFKHTRTDAWLRYL